MKTITLATFLDEAKEYTEEEARRIERNRDTDKAWPADQVRTAASLQVDVQRLGRVVDAQQTTNEDKPILDVAQCVKVVSGLLRGKGFDVESHETIGLLQVRRGASVVYNQYVVNEFDTTMSMYMLLGPKCIADEIERSFMANCTTYASGTTQNDSRNGFAKVGGMREAEGNCSNVRCLRTHHFELHNDAIFADLKPTCIRCGALVVNLKWCNQT